MKLKSFHCHRFAGLIDKKIDFEDGLNIVFGPNEAGKTTIVEGIFATLFKEFKIKKNTKQGKEFIERFTPYPEGDVLKATLVFTAEGKSYKLTKTWGISPSIELVIDEYVYRDNEVIEEKLCKILQHGKSTYERIVFAKQKEIREALEKLSEDTETAQNIGDLLRKAVMELSGVSVEGLKSKIQDEYKSISGRWDIQSRRPDKNRGIDNPWKAGVGSVLKRYYAKEEIYRRMKEVQEIEEEHSRTVEELREIEKEIEKYVELIKEYSEIEGDITKRARIEPEKERLEEKIEVLQRISEEFPKKKMLLAQTKKKMEELVEEEKELEEELKQAEILKSAEQDKKILQDYNIKDKEKDKLLKDKEAVEMFTEEVINTLDAKNSVAEKSRASIAGATLTGKLIKTPGPVEITRGLEKPEKMYEGRIFNASGYLKAVTEDGFELEVRAGEIDFEQLKENLDQAEEEIRKILDNLKIHDIKQAKEKYGEHCKLESKVQQLSGEIKTLLGDRKIEEIQKGVTEIESVQTRPIDFLKEKIKEKTELLQDTRIDEKLLDEKIKEWEAKYVSVENLLNLLGDAKAKLNQIEKELDTLAKVPKEFDSAEEFQEKLSDYREMSTELRENEKRVRSNYYVLEAQLPETTYEELQKQYEWAELELEKEEKKLQKVIAIQAMLEEVLKEVDKASFKKLQSSFSKYLEKLTCGNYKSGNVIIDDNVEIEIVRKDNIPIPTKLFSAGTYDGVSLAFRLAVLEYLFQDTERLLMLDDCLINLDAHRTTEAVSLIEEFARDNQVILFTCKPETRDKLTGQVIKI